MRMLGEGPKSVQLSILPSALGRSPSGHGGRFRRPSLSGGNCPVKRPFRDTCRRARRAETGRSSDERDGWDTPDSSHSLTLANPPDRQPVVARASRGMIQGHRMRTLR